ncbi:MAG: purine-nucleoside phosphorylase [Gemmatimonadota bacterium]
MDRPEDANIAAGAEAISSRLEGREPTVALVLGSGLAGLADRIENPVRIAYSEIPGWFVPTILGHKGELVIGTLGGRMVIGQSGRFHLYEGHSADDAALPVRVFHRLGIRTLVVTNAAGGVRRQYGAGTVMLIADHLNLTGRNPLVGPVRAGEERFPDMTAAYDPALRSLATQVAARVGVVLAEGVYAGLLGPSYETPAEVRMLDRLGADAVGMSTVLEVIAARALGIRCLGFSLVTNPGAGLSAAMLSHLEVMEVAGAAGKEVARIIEAVLADDEFARYSDS